MKYYIKPRISQIYAGYEFTTKIRRNTKEKLIDINTSFTFVPFVVDEIVVL